MLTDLANASFMWTQIRRLWAFFDKFIFSAMAFVYRVFLNVASQNILGGAVSKALIGRMQLIVGVVFLFVFAVNIVRGIIEPDMLRDKEKGSTKLIIKVIISLFLIACMIPLNIPGADSGSGSIIEESTGYTWEQALSEQGILFGTLTFFQNKVLETNVLGKLILGSNVSNYDTMNNGSIRDGEQTDYGLSTAGDYMATEILKRFITPNQQPDYIAKDNGGVSAGDPTEDDDTGYICSGTPEFSDPVKGRLGLYQEEYDVNKLFGYIDNTCYLDNDAAGKNVGDSDMAGDYYMFSYMGGFSTIVGVFVFFVLVSFTLEIAVRVFKLLILRIMAPIAAVGYAIPSSSSNNLFSTWAKQVAVTYVDVFVRLAIIYFSILVVSGLLSEGFAGSKIYDPSTGVGFFTVIFLVIALFLFAKQAPKYVKSLFGISDDDSKGLFGGLATLAGAALGIAGAAGSGIAGAASGFLSKRQNGGSMPDSILSGLGGGFGGLFRGGAAALAADSNMGRGKAAFQAGQQANARRYAQARANVSNSDRMRNRLHSLITGEPMSQTEQAKADEMQEAIDNKTERLGAMNRSLAQKETLRNNLDAIKKRAAGEVGKYKQTKGDFGLTEHQTMHFDTQYFKNKAKYGDGTIGKVNLKHFDAQLAGARSRGSSTVDFVDDKNHWHSVAIEQAEHQRGLLAANNEADYIENYKNYNINDSEMDGSIAAVKRDGYTGPITRSEIGNEISRLNTDIETDNNNIAAYTNEIENDKNNLAAQQKEVKRQSTIDSFNQK